MPETKTVVTKTFTLEEVREALEIPEGAEFCILRRTDTGTEIFCVLDVDEDLFATEWEE